MNKLVIDNHVIDADMLTILKTIKSELTNVKLSEISPKGDYIRVTCPHHKAGGESHASCSVYCGDNDNIQYGMFNCFTCHESGPLWKFVAECFDQDDEWGKEWLLEHFGDTFYEKTSFFDELTINKNIEKTYLNETLLDNFQSYHPYMDARKLSREICEKYKVKYDPETRCIVFPVWDEYGHLVMLTRRSVIDKTFIIDKGVDKPVYLLDKARKDNLKQVFVCESQINCLTLESWGYRAVALFGTGSKHQYDILNKSGIRCYNLCFDGDDAGDKGRDRFIKNINKDCMINVVRVPRGKDINDLTKEEFDKLLNETMEGF